MRFSGVIENYRSAEVTYGAPLRGRLSRGGPGAADTAALSRGASGRAFPFSLLYITLDEPQMAGIDLTVWM